MTAAALPTVERCPEVQGSHQCALLAHHGQQHILDVSPARGWAKPSRISSRTRYVLGIGLVGLTAVVALASRPL